MSGDDNVLVYLLSLSFYSTRPRAARQTCALWRLCALGALVSCHEMISRSSSKIETVALATLRESGRTRRLRLEAFSREMTGIVPLALLGEPLKNKSCSPFSGNVFQVCIWSAAISRGEDVID